MNVKVRDENGQGQNCLPPLLSECVAEVEATYLLFTRQSRSSRLMFVIFLCLPPDHPGKSETYLEAIRKNIEWLKKHNKDEGKEGETHTPIFAEFLH